jgi:hypothetical protein
MASKADFPFFIPFLLLQTNQNCDALYFDNRAPLLKLKLAKEHVYVKQLLAFRHAPHH